MKLFVWGTGRLVGKVVGVHVKEENIMGFIDNNCIDGLYMDKPVFRPHEMVGKEYDAILVANLYRKDIYEQCKELGIDLAKVIFLYNNYELADVNQDYGLSQTYWEKNMPKLLEPDIMWCVRRKFLERDIAAPFLEGRG